MKELIGVSCFLLMGLSLQGCGFSESNLGKLLETNACQKCYLSGADLKGENLEGANLKGANLTGADLTKTNLEGADLAGTNLTNTDLTNATLEYARNFNTADTTGAIFCRTIMPDGTKNKSGC